MVSHSGVSAWVLGILTIMLKVALNDLLKRLTFRFVRIPPGGNMVLR